MAKSQRKPPHLGDYKGALLAPTESVIGLLHWVHAVAAMALHQADRGRGSAQHREAVRKTAQAAAQALSAAVVAVARGHVEETIEIDSPPPDEPLARNLYAGLILVRHLRGLISGTQLDYKTLGELRRHARTVAQILPADVALEAREILKRCAPDAKRRKSPEAETLPRRRPTLRAG